MHLFVPSPVHLNCSTVVAIFFVSSFTLWNSIARLYYTFIIMDLIINLCHSCVHVCIQSFV